MKLDLSNQLEVKKAETYLNELVKSKSIVHINDVTVSDNLEKILYKIHDIIETYESGAYRDLKVMHRELTCLIYYLSKEQTDANVRWNNEYYNHESKVNAAKERHADKEVSELYMCRKIMESAKGVSIAMGYEIKMN